MPRPVRHGLHSGVSSIQLLNDVNLEILARPLRVGADSGCGGPGCETEQRLLDESYPPLLGPLYPPAQYEAFVHSLNRALVETAVPTCPLFGLSVLVPPVCCLFWYWRESRALEREESLAQLIEAENSRLSRLGLQWTEAQFAHSSFCGVKAVPRLRGSVTLHLNVAVRAAYELGNPPAVQYLANKLLERSHRLVSQGSTALLMTPTAGAAVPLADPPALPEGGMQQLDETQALLLQRQVTLVRKASMSRGGGDAAASTPGASGTPNRVQSGISIAVLNDPNRWAQATTIAKPDTFQPVLPVQADAGKSPPAAQRMG